MRTRSKSLGNEEWETLDESPKKRSPPKKRKSKTNDCSDDEFVMAEEDSPPKKSRATKSKPKKVTRERKSSEEDSEMSQPASSPEPRSPIEAASVEKSPEVEGDSEEISQKSEDANDDEALVDKRGWSWVQRKVWEERHQNPNQFYYRHNEPGQPNLGGQWSPREQRAFFKRLAEFGPRYWGLFSQPIYGRVGYQCCSFYRQAIAEGIVTANGKVSPHLYAQPDETEAEAESKLIHREPTLVTRMSRPRKQILRSSEIEWLEADMKNAKTEDLENMGSTWGEEMVEVVIEETKLVKKPKEVVVEEELTFEETEYERMRRQQIEKNKEQMKLLGLMAEKEESEEEEVEETVVVERKLVKRKMRRSTRITTVASRISI